jgi:O-antigen/teichoic acid export membrane protein
MRSRLLWRRSATALGYYGSVLLGVAGTVVAARLLHKDPFGRFALVLAAASFFQSLLDLTVEEAVVKFGFRYQARAQWGRLRMLLQRALVFKLVGAALAAVCVVVLAVFSGTVFGASSLRTPLLVAALLPLAAAPESLGATVLVLRGRYDLRAGFLSLSMALRLVALAIGASHGVTWAIASIVIAQVFATIAAGAAGLAGMRRFPATRREPLADDRRAIVSFAAQSSIATGVVSFRPTIGQLLLGVVSSTTQVGLFKIAQSPQLGLAAASAPVRIVLLTEQTRDWEGGERQRVLAGVRRYMLGATALMAVVVPVAWWLMRDLIRIAFGAGYGGAVEAARIVLIAAAVWFVLGWTKSFPVSIGRPNLRILAHGAETLVLVPLVLVLGASSGATGAAYATLVSTLVFAAIWAVLFVRISGSDSARDDPRPAARATAG